VTPAPGEKESQNGEDAFLLSGFGGMILSAGDPVPIVEAEKILT
jgi:hypothetical protein